MALRWKLTGLTSNTLPPGWTLPALNSATRSVASILQSRMGSYLARLRLDSSYAVTTAAARGPRRRIDGNRKPPSQVSSRSDQVEGLMQGSVLHFWTRPRVRLDEGDPIVVAPGLHQAFAFHRAKILHSDPPISTRSTDPDTGSAPRPQHRPLTFKHHDPPYSPSSRRPQKPTSNPAGDPRPGAQARTPARRPPAHR